MLIRFDFVGGPKDGEMVCGDSDGPFETAAAYYHASSEGSPGRFVWCRPEYLIELTQLLSDSALLDLHSHGSPLRGHLYEVFYRSRGEQDVLIRARHVGPTPSHFDSARASQMNAGRSRLSEDAPAPLSPDGDIARGHRREETGL